MLVDLSKHSVAARSDATRTVSPFARSVVWQDLSGAAAGDEKRLRGGPPEDLIPELVTWAPSSDQPRQLALLGDSGTGKTTAAKLLTERLIENYRTNPGAPLPLHLDLRDLDTRDLPPGVNLEGLLDRLLGSLDLPEGKLSGADVLKLTRTRPCVIVLDGLDEVLGRLEPKEAEQIMRLLWRFLETADPAQAGQSRLLASCRTHYFRSAADESARFTGHGREGRKKADFRVFEMAEFSDDQIKEFLRLNVPTVDPEVVLEQFGRLHDLTDLARRPMLLRLMADRLDTILIRVGPGRTMTAADLYDSLAHGWLRRDKAKESLLPEHKLLLMEDLAAHLATTGAVGLSIDEAEERMLDFLADHPKLERRYAQRAPALWMEDLRTSTFLVRRGDDLFTFAHTSLREYFHARHLVSALRLDVEAARRAWSGLNPSHETWQFVGQLLAGRQPPGDGSSTIDSGGFASLEWEEAPVDTGLDLVAIVCPSLALAYQKKVSVSGAPARRARIEKRFLSWRVIVCCRRRRPGRGSVRSGR